MADQKPAKPPAYDELAAENAALRQRVASLGAEVRRLQTEAKLRDGEAARRPRTRVMDPKSPNPFLRPWDGR